MRRRGGLMLAGVVATLVCAAVSASCTWGTYTPSAEGGVAEGEAGEDSTGTLGADSSCGGAGEPCCDGDMCFGPTVLCVGGTCIASNPTDEASTDARTDAPSFREASDADAAYDAASQAPRPEGCAADAVVIAMTTDSSPAFDTTGAVCVTYEGNIDGWGADSAEGRSVTVVGATTQTLTPIPMGDQPGLDAGADGYIYWNYSAGTFNFTSMYVF